MNISKVFGFDFRESVAIIGSHGKTSLCLALANEYSDKKVALTTTTKIFPVTKSDLHVKNFYNFYDKDLPKALKNGVNVFGKSCKNGKISSLHVKELKHLHSISDILIYEADGSKAKPLKAWESYEPVILEDTTVAIGVIPLHVMGKIVDESLIHRFELFCKTFDVKKGDQIDETLFIKIINEMFKKVPKSVKKILLLNRYDARYDKSVKIICDNFLHVNIYVGSIKEKNIKKIQ